MIGSRLNGQESWRLERMIDEVSSRIRLPEGVVYTFGKTESLWKKLDRLIECNNEFVVVGFDRGCEAFKILTKLPKGDLANAFAQELYNSGVERWKFYAVYDSNNDLVYVAK